MLYLKCEGYVFYMKLYYVISIRVVYVMGR